MWDFVMDKNGDGAGFLRELRGFPRTIYIPSASPQSSSLSLEAGTIGQEWPHKPSKKKTDLRMKVVGIELIWLRIGTGVGRLLTRY
jgi:hypothetical protein